MERLLGSQFSYYDLGLPYLRWPDPKVVGEDRMRGAGLLYLRGEGDR